MPCQWNTGKPVRTRHHKEWDKVVRKVAGGLTIFKPSKGQWVQPDTNQLFEERMIPVRVACNEKQLDAILKHTLRHYKQHAVMAYEVSQRVKILNAPIPQTHSN